MFSASIPKKIFFKKAKSGYSFNRIRNDWSLLPEKSPYQNPDRIKGGLKKFDVFSSDDAKSNSYLLKNGFIGEDNQPIRLRLVGYAMPGRVYDTKKYDLIVATPNGIHFSISHDVFLNAILESGLEPGGMLPGKYIFVKFAKHTRPIQVNSNLHKAVLDYINDRRKTKIKIKQLQVGEVYSTGAGNLGLFLGFVNTELMQVTLPPGTEKYFSSRINSVKDPLIDFEVTYKEKTLLSLWMDLGNKNEGYDVSPDTLNEQVTKVINDKLFYRFSVKDQHRFNDKVSTKKIQLPDDIIQKVRNITANKLSDLVEKEKHYRANPDLTNYNSLFQRPKVKTPLNPPDILRHYDALRIAEYSQVLNMVPFGMKPIKADVCKLFDKWTK